MHQLNQIEKERYNRQILFWNEGTQLNLKNKRVLVLGAGGLGSPVLLYLAVAGVGTIKICDFDSVQLSNLNRQIIHGIDRIRINKAESAALSLRKLNDQIEIIPITEKLTADNFTKHSKDCDLFIDVCDSVETKEKLNSCIVEQKIPAIMSAIVGCGGYTFFNTPESICWFCLFNEVFANGSKKKLMPFSDFPSLGAPIGMLGGTIANMAISQLLGNGGGFYNKLFYTPQLWNFHKLKVVEKVFSMAMTDNLKNCIKHQDPKYPLGTKFIEQNNVSKDPLCKGCSSK